MARLRELRVLQQLRFWLGVQFLFSVVEMLLKRSLSSLFGRFKRIYRFRHSPSLCFLFSKIQGLIPLFIGDDSGLTSICEICEYP